MSGPEGTSEWRRRNHLRGREVHFIRGQFEIDLQSLALCYALAVEIRVANFRVFF